MIGKRKLIYDSWGDTVNTASRMESHAVDGQIQIGLSVANISMARTSKNAARSLSKERAR